MYLTSFVTTRIGVELAAVQRKLPDRAVVGLQLYSARIFHITLSPRIYKGGQGPPRNTSSTPKVTQTTTQDVGYYATRGPNLSKSLCFLHHSSSRAVDPYLQTLLLRVSLSRLGGKHRQLVRQVGDSASLLESFDMAIFSMGQLVRWLSKPPEPLATQTHEPKKKVLP